MKRRSFNLWFIDTTMRYVLTVTHRLAHPVPTKNYVNCKEWQRGRQLFPDEIIKLYMRMCRTFFGQYANMEWIIMRIFVCMCLCVCVCVCAMSVPTEEELVRLLLLLLLFLMLFHVLLLSFYGSVANQHANSRLSFVSFDPIKQNPIQVTTLAKSIIWN